jgi:tetratricopeptide (TPR) repeat protein
MAESPRIEELKRRVRVDPASIAFAALAEEYRRAGEYDEAVATCLAGLQRHPAYLSARVTLGRALIELGRYDEAREHLEQVLRIAPENLAAIRGLAEIHHRRSELPESVDQEDATPAGTTRGDHAAALGGDSGAAPALGDQAGAAEEQSVAPRAPDAASTSPDAGEPAPEPVSSPPRVAIRPVRLSTIDAVEIETSGSVGPRIHSGAVPEGSPAVARDGSEDRGPAVEQSPAADPAATEPASPGFAERSPSPVPAEEPPSSVPAEEPPSPILATEPAPPVLEMESAPLVFLTEPAPRDEAAEHLSPALEAEPPPPVPAAEPPRAIEPEQAPAVIGAEDSAPGLVEDVEPDAVVQPPPIQIQFHPPMSRRLPHPDESALPALEALHDALVRARSAPGADQAEYR